MSNRDDYLDDILGEVLPSTATIPIERHPVLARIVSVVDAGDDGGMPEYSARLLDVAPHRGAVVVPENKVFPSVRADAPVVLYPIDGGRWSFHDPAWELPGPGLDGSAGPFLRADLGTLFGSHAKTAREALTAAQAAGVRVEGDELARVDLDVVHRRLAGVADLPMIPSGTKRKYLRARARGLSRAISYGDPVVRRRPADLEGGAIAALPGYGWMSTFPDEATGKKSKKALTVIVDPTTRPVALAPFREDCILWVNEIRSHPHPGLYMLAMRALGLRAGRVPGSIARIEDDRLLVDLYGVRHPIFDSDTSWTAPGVLADRFSSGQTIYVGVRLIRDRLRLFLSLLSPEDPDWVVLSRRFPPETRFRSDQWHYLRDSPEGGQLVRIRDGDHEVNGLIPDGDPEAAAGAPPDLVVVAHNPNACRFELKAVSSDPTSALSTSVWEAGASFRPGEPVTGIVTQVATSGLRVDVGGVECILPKPAYGDYFRPGEELEGRLLTCDVDRVDHIRRRVTLTRVQITARERLALYDAFNMGDRILGVVKNIADFGAFVDLGGIDGLLHITDMSWGRINHPSDMVQIDDQIEVMVLHVDKDREKIALGLKQKSASPWENVADKYPVGTRVLGEVVNVMSYGAFVKLEEGIEGLVHISEMSWTKRINHPSELVNIGDKIEVVVLGINKEKQEISLGMKQTQTNPWDQVAHKYPPGTMIEGTVRNLTNYGAFIEIEEGIDGLLHISDMSWTRKIGHPNEVLEKGQKIRCQVLNVDQDRKRIALGLKQLKDDPWETDIPNRYGPGDVVVGKVTKLTNFGAFVELEPGLEGLVHISVMGDLTDPESIGQEVEVMVLRIDKEERKIGLSRKLGGLDNLPNSLESLVPFESRVEGRVVEILPSGLKIELDSGNFGRLSWLETCWDAPGIEDVWSVGTRLELLVIGYPKYIRDRSHWEVDLSLRLTQSCPWSDQDPASSLSPGETFDGKVIWVDPLGHWVRVRPMDRPLVVLVQRPTAHDSALDDFAELRAGHTVEHLKVVAYYDRRKQFEARLPKFPAPQPEKAQVTSQGPPAPTPPVLPNSDLPFDRYPVRKKFQGPLESWDSRSGQGTIALADGVAGRLIIPPTDKRRSSAHLYVGSQVEVEVTGHATKKNQIMVKLVSIL